MPRNAVWAVAVLAAALTGCSMCQSPFDYCGPVAGPNGCPNCDFGARRNSAFHPMEGSPDDLAVGPTPAAISPAYEDAGPQELPPPDGTLEEEAAPLVR